MKISKLLAGAVSAALIFGMAAALPRDAGLFETVVVSAADEILSDGVLKYKVLDDGTLSVIEHHYGSYYDSIVIPESYGGRIVTQIGYYAFGTYYNSNVESVTIPKTVTSIGDKAFTGCTRLYTVKFAEGSECKSIGKDAFRLGKLSRINLPDSITEIGDYAFAGCVFTTVPIPKGITTINTGVFHGCNKITSLTIPDNIVSIGDEAFSCCRALSEVELGNSINSIGASAFVDTKIERIDLPNSITTIGDSAFKDVVSLSLEQLPQNLEYIGDHAFSGCISLENIDIPSSVCYLGDGAFESCTNITNIHIPDGLTEVSNSCFKDCSRLKYITIPSSVRQIGDYAFSGTAFREVILPNGLEEIGDYAFSNTSFRTIDIPSSVNYIGDGAFLGSNLREITIPDGIDRIRRETFSGCKELTNIVLPSSVTSLEEYAFAYCNFESFVIPDSIVSIGNSAFLSCTNLNEISIANSVESIGDLAFSHCTQLKNFNMPDSVKTIGTGLFVFCTSLENIKISKSITVIPSKRVFPTESFINYPEQIGLFYECTNLNNVIIPDGVEILTRLFGNEVDSNGYGREAFNYNKLRNYAPSFNIRIPKSVDEINGSFPNNTIVYCYKNSFAEEWAQDNNYQYEIIDSSNHVHKFSLFEEQKDSSCELPGEIKHTCICGETETEQINPKGHNYVSNIIPPTTDEEGYTKKVCTICGKTIITDYVPKLISITSCNTTLKYTALTYSASGVNADKYLTIKDGDKTLVQGVDYETSYTNNKTVGYQTCTLTITGKGDYTGSIEKKLTIKPPKLAAPTLSTKDGGIVVKWSKVTTDALGYQVIYDKVADFDTSAKGHTADYHTTTVTDLNTLTKTLSAYTKPGETWYVKVRAFITNDGTTDGTRYGTFSAAKKIVVKGNLSSASIPYSSYTYTGKEIKPTVTVKDSKGSKLSASDYTVTYSNNKAVGKATIKIVGKGSYQGTLTKTFVIKPKAGTLTLTAGKASFKASWTKNSSATGYQITYSKDKNFKSGVTNYNVSKNSTTSANFSSKPKSGETWYVKYRAYVTIGGKKYYGSYSAVKTVKTK